MDSTEPEPYFFKPNWGIGGGITFSLALWVAGLIADQQRNTTLRDRLFIGRSIASLATVGLITYDIKTQQKAAQLHNAAMASPPTYPAASPATTTAAPTVAPVMSPAAVAAKKSLSEPPSLSPAAKESMATRSEEGGFWRFVGSLGPKPRALEPEQVPEQIDRSDIARHINKQIAKEKKEKAAIMAAKASGDS